MVMGPVLVKMFSPTTSTTNVEGTSSYLLYFVFPFYCSNNILSAALSIFPLGGFTPLGSFTPLGGFMPLGTFLPLGAFMPLGTFMPLAGTVTIDYS